MTLTQRVEPTGVVVGVATMRNPVRGSHPVSRGVEKERVARLSPPLAVSVVGTHGRVVVSGVVRVRVDE
jgi:hypothetical protein